MFYHISKLICIHFLSRYIEFIIYLPKFTAVLQIDPQTATQQKKNIQKIIKILTQQN
jgi:hypothetical protein